MSFVEMGIGWFTPIERLLERVSSSRPRASRRSARARQAACCCSRRTSRRSRSASRCSRRSTPRASCMYRPQRNAMMDVMIRRGRHRFAKEQIPRDNVRALCAQLARQLRRAYLPDQTYLGKQSELLPFFGEPAVTNTATSKLAAISGATVLPYFFRRLPERRLSRRHRPAARRTFRASRRRATRERLFGAARGVHPARAGAISLALQEIQRPACRRSPTSTRADGTLAAKPRSRLATRRRRGGRHH